MKKTLAPMRYTLLCIIILLAACTTQPAGERTVNIIPAPYQAVPGDGTYALKSGAEVNYSDATLKPIALDLASCVKALAGLDLKVAAAPAAAPKGIYLQTGQVTGLPQAYGLSPKDGDTADENYILNICKKTITITGAAAEGVARGVTTLKQLIGGNLDEKSAAVHLPVIEVTDGPRFAWRGLSLDVSRCFFSVEEVKQVIDMAALYKLNVLHLHLSDNQGWRIEIKKYPELTRTGAFIDNNGKTGGFYTQDDLKQLIAYAAERFVTILPEVDLPGHTAAVFASYPEFRNAVNLGFKVTIPGQAFNALDVDDPKAMAFTEAVIEEMAALSPGAYLHVGGDEAIGLDENKYKRYVNAVREMVKKNGKKYVGWQETARTDIGEGDLFQHWIYMNKVAADPDREKRRAQLPEELKKVMALYGKFMMTAAGDPALGISKGAKVILSPSGYAYLDQQYKEESADSTQSDYQQRLGMAEYGKQTIAEIYDWDPMTFNPTVEDGTKDVAGIEAAIWCESVTRFDELQFLMMPRLAGIAEKAWSAVENTSWDEYRIRLGAQAPLLEQAGWNYFKSSLVDWKE